MSQPEAQLWKSIKKVLEPEKFFLTRIETQTISGVPDVFGAFNGVSFWLELKSNKVSFPTLNKYQIVWINRAIKNNIKIIILHKAQKEKALKIYEPRSFFTDPRAIKPVFICEIPVDWPLLVDRFKRAVLT
jgi:hypothetical protein